MKEALFASKLDHLADGARGVWGKGARVGFAVLLAYRRSRWVWSAAELGHLADGAGVRGGSVWGGGRWIATLCTLWWMRGRGAAAVAAWRARVRERRRLGSLAGTRPVSLGACN